MSGGTGYIDTGSRCHKGDRDGSIDCRNGGGQEFVAISLNELFDPARQKSEREGQGGTERMVDNGFQTVLRRNKQSIRAANKGIE